MKAKVLITGAGGQLGNDLLEVLGRRYTCIGLTRQQLDVADGAAVRKAMNDYAPDIVVHAAAYTKVDQAEAEPDLAYMVNAFGARNVAQCAEKLGASLVYVSTDYVFDGRKGAAYHEQDRTAPLNVYGASKLLGEKFALMFCSRTFVVRTSWLYGWNGTNFVAKIWKSVSEGKPLAVVADQFGSPTFTRDLAECIDRLAETDRYGIYHAANEGCCSRWELARTILRLGGLGHVPVQPVETERYPAPAVRPVYSALENRALHNNGFPPMRDWESALAAFMAQYSTDLSL